MEKRNENRENKNSRNEGLKTPISEMGHFMIGKKEVSASDFLAAFKKN